jgi:hypothetical protein
MQSFTKICTVQTMPTRKFSKPCAIIPNQGELPKKEKFLYEKQDLELVPTTPAIRSISPDTLRVSLKPGLKVSRYSHINSSK